MPGPAGASRPAFLALAVLSAALVIAGLVALAWSRPLGVGLIVAGPLSFLLAFGALGFGDPQACGACGAPVPRRSGRCPRCGQPFRPRLR